MALRFVDNFDSYATADVPDRWTASAAAVIAPGAGRNGTAGLQAAAVSTARHVTKVLDAQGTWIVGFAYQPTIAGPSTIPILRLLDGATVQCDVRVTSGGNFSVTRNGTLLGTSSLAVALGTYYFLEFKCAIADSGGTYELRVDGVVVVSGTGDTKNTANATADRVQLGLTDTFGYASNIDDVYVCDGTGSTHNDFLGDSKAIPGRPTGAGATTAWTPSAGANWECVDDAAPDDDATYTESVTPGQVDTFAVPALAATPVAIHGVQVSFNARKTDAGPASVAAVLRSGGVDYVGATVPLSTTYTYVSHIWESDPATGLPWTKAGVDACQVGYKYVA